jgi:hypothetical protein
MWVIVRLGKDGHYVGELNNHPVGIDAKAGDEVRFDARHVLELR